MYAGLAYMELSGTAAVEHLFLSLQQKKGGRHDHHHLRPGLGRQRRHAR